MQPRFASLTPDEERTLREGQQHGPQFQFRNRCLCILLSHQKQSVGWLKDHFQVSRLTIYNWLDAWEQQGLRGLYNQPGQGRKPILTSADEALVNQHVSAHAQQLKAARQVLRQELNREFSHKTLQRFLKSVAGAGSVSDGV
ncbi:helix-turn-helix domain-containing protein [Spirosoma endbachense]|uniref:Helix-turn-helix domain-containing protein n=1 Tax=Spirosoma endbachense TaxID=2666025 RepID=A0A6P1WB40_9BACT|nr:helix-turn-helix domain-containing protein [Spirosoma endbachense]QHW01101.1 helix-turn-helix domain-containing protein [Spirosoma endbachense]